MSTINIHNYNHLKVGDIFHYFGPDKSTPNIFQIVDYNDQEIKCLIIYHPSDITVKIGRLKTYSRKDIEEFISSSKIQNPIIVINRSVNEHSKEYLANTLINRISFLE